MSIPKWFNLANFTESLRVLKALSLSIEMIHIFNYFKTHDNKCSTGSLEGGVQPRIWSLVIKVNHPSSNPDCPACWPGNLG